MLKEILEQAHSLDAAIRQDDTVLQDVARLIKKHHTFPIGCGTAAKMARVGEIYFAHIGGVLTQSLVGSEWAPYEKLIGKSSLLFAVSQSGETADVLEALRAAHKRGATIVSLLNVALSSMERMSDKTLSLNVGPEIAVASTKAATAQIAVLYLIAHALGGTLGEGKHTLRALVRDVKKWLGPDLSQSVRVIAEKILRESDIYVIGRGVNAPIAAEAAIKIQEVSYIHAEGFPGGELKHGPIALIRPGTPCIVLMPSDSTRVEIESNAMELKSRGARIIGIAPDPNPLFDEWIETPRAGDASPIVNLIPIQLLAYHLSVLRGIDPDKPRNLAKSVTVK
jgi:glucosamine--fructose-6-phosphate aminotransferase (isomerizing)